MALTKKHKNQLFAGLIGIVILALTLIVKKYITTSEPENTKRSDTTQTIIQSPTISSISKDSSKQSINQLNQVNQNKGDVNNEFVSGDKKTYNSYNQLKTKSKDTAIVNNGFINNGGNGNTYNQSINNKPEPRHLNENDTKILFKIPAYYEIEIDYILSCKECEKYSIELEKYLISVGYNVKLNGLLMQIINPPCSQRFCFLKSDTKDKVNLVVHPIEMD